MLDYPLSCLFLLLKNGKYNMYIICLVPYFILPITLVKLRCVKYYVTYYVRGIAWIIVSIVYISFYIIYMVCIARIIHHNNIHPCRRYNMPCIVFFFLKKNMYHFLRWLCIIQNIMNEI